MKLIDEVKPALVLASRKQPDLTEALNIIKPWEKQSPSKRNSTTGKYFKQLLKFVPTSPTRPKITTDPSISVSIEYERYVLRALGYQGDLYEDRIVQQEGHVFDRVQADKDVEGYRRTLAAQKASGELYEVWIHPKPKPSGAGRG